MGGDLTKRSAWEDHVICETRVSQKYSKWQYEIPPWHFLSLSCNDRFKGRSASEEYFSLINSLTAVGGVAVVAPKTIFRAKRRGGIKQYIFFPRRRPSTRVKVPLFSFSLA